MSASRPALSRYSVTIRSFHPKKSFGYSGFWFGGDNRGFSTKPNSDRSITSRIYHRVEVDLAKRDIISRDVGSDPSKPPWSDSKYRYKNKSIGPKSEIKDKRFYSLPSKNLYWAHVRGRYYGTNHAMPLSEEMQERIGTTYVPAINIQYAFAFELDLDQGHLDLILEASGDGFPNHEAFVRGPGGKPVFLGGHVRNYNPMIALPGGGGGEPMIASAVRLPLNSTGEFTGRVASVGPERRDSRDRLKAKEMAYRRIEAWNQNLTTRNPNAGRCMALETFSLEGCWPSW